MHNRQHRRIAQGRWVAVVMLVSAGFLAGVAPGGAIMAAPAAQQTITVGAEQPVVVSLDGAAPQVSYRFECFANGVASVYTETTSGDLMVEIAVLDPNAVPFASGGVEQKNPNISVVEAFIMPADGSCTITLSRVGDTAGSAALRLLPGYALLDKWDAFDGSGPPLRMDWSPYLSDTLEVDIRDQQLAVTVMSDNLLGYVLPEDDGLDWADVYIQADFVIDGDPSYFEYGFLLRSDYEGETFYSLTVSSDSDWSFYYLRDDWNEIQPWTPVPTIDGSDHKPRLGVWMQGSTVRLYFNDHYVSEVTDENAFAANGLIGIAVATGVDQFDFLTAHIDNVVITRPFAGRAVAALPFGDQAGNQDQDQQQAEPTATSVGALSDVLGLGGETGPTPTPTTGSLFGLDATSTPETVAITSTPTRTPIPPTPRSTATPEVQGLTLRNWASASPEDIVRELQGYDLVPFGGSLALTVPSSFGETSQSGFHFYPMGQGRTFRDFVLTFDARLDAGLLQSGCGMHFRHNSSSTSLAAVFADGTGYLAQWLGATDSHPATWYDSHPAIKGGLGVTNRITVVANGPLLLMYVNGDLVAGDEFDDATGEVALEVYVAEDESGGTQRTYCQLSDIWLWEF